MANNNMEEITIKDIAKMCGVGVSTVSRAINNHPDINPETKEKILQVIKDYKYIPNNSARNLKRQESKTIAVLIKGISNPFFLSMLGAVEEAVDKEHFDYVIQRVSETEDEIKVAVQLEKEKRLRGIIFLGASFIRNEMDVRQISVPFVFCTLAKLNGVDDTLYSSVSIDDYKEAAKMTEYLIGLGHTKIALLAGRKQDISIGFLRMKGYEDTLLKHGLAVDPELIIHMNEELYEPYSMDNGYYMMKEMLKKEVDFTAVFALSDSMAIGAARALLEEGKRIPEDYSVCGFDGTKEGRYYYPSITTIDQPAKELMKKSVEILFDLIHERGENCHSVVEAKLREGESTKSIK